MNIASVHQMSFDLTQAVEKVPPTREALREIMRQKGPCRFLAAFCEPGQPSDTYEVFHQMVKDGEFVVVKVLHFDGSPGTLGFKDEVYDLANKRAACN